MACSIVASERCVKALKECRTHDTRDEAEETAPVVANARVEAVDRRDVTVVEGRNVVVSFTKDVEVDEDGTGDRGPAKVKVRVSISGLSLGTAERGP